MRTATLTKVVIFIILIVALLVGGTYVNRWLDQRALENERQTAEQGRAEQQRIMDAQQRAMDALKKEDVTVGTGDEAKNGDVVTVNYVGSFDDGKTFDSTYDSTYGHQQPLEFILGTSQIIPGWNLGILGMKVGGKRNLVIPPELAYGAQGKDTIPPNSTLHFTVELLKVASST